MAKYRLHGLVIESELPFPALDPCIQGAAPDVVVRVGTTPPSLPDARTWGVCFAARPGEFLIWKEGVARFFVSGGREIVIEPARGASASEIQRLFLTSPIGALLLQRRWLPLQASAVASRGGAVLFVAGSCVGKSTLAMACCTRGARLLADDLAAVHTDTGGEWVIPPAYPAIKLWPLALRWLGMEPDDFLRLRPELEKRVVPCSERFEGEPRPLKAICFLRRDDGPGDANLLPVAPAQGLAMLMNHVYRTPLGVGLGVQAGLFERAAALARSVRLLHAIQPRKGFRVTELADQILEELER